MFQRDWFVIYLFNLFLRSSITIFTNIYLMGLPKMADMAGPNVLCSVWLKDADFIWAATESIRG